MNVNSENIVRIEETEFILSRLLQTVFKNNTIQKQLQEILSILSEIPWLDINFKGGIFLKNKKNELVLVAHENIDKDIQERCFRLECGECYCGVAATSKKIIYSDIVSDIEYKGVLGKKHYSIPLIAENDTFGVIILYLSEDHVQKEGELAFIHLLSSIISNIVGKRILDEKFKINKFKTEYFQRELLHKLVEASEFRDNETGKHIKRVTEYCVLIAKKLKLPASDIELLKLGAPLHDVGKISIADSILLKPGKLTSEEYDEMKTHAKAGGELLSDIGSSYLSAARDIALTHHEKWDGTGYPNGLKEENIPLFGRICAIADVFDALSTERPYKKPWPIEKVINFLQENSGKHFDPKLLDLFLNSMDEVLQIKELYQDDMNEIDHNLFLKKFESEKESFVSWDDSLSTGVDSIDNEHRYLIRLINNLYNSIKENSDVSIVLITIKDLREYTSIHFRDEEAFMRKFDYKHYEYHVKLHQYFESKLKEFENDVLDMPFLVGFEILEFLRDWLVDHILNIDTKVTNNLP